ncbi:hypothetical protein CROQUDRAFT_101083 [Cronartium quercuum f. sp. fusiforme G11]|uniref:Uncharacterized protein n=1 Tax=Cronartium quercuum f. sp. fusiforme G11 TaxID=708437 RepID=A0A9P6T6T9_9BASI|nr:hypothetical protein CROQUDRAFT_101083 [Cronartium quercuum f. sp. fusiforme G11]
MSSGQGHEGPGDQPMPIGESSRPRESKDLRDNLSLLFFFFFGSFTPSIGLIGALRDSLDKISGTGIQHRPSSTFASANRPPPVTMARTSNALGLAVPALHQGSKAKPNKVPAAESALIIRHQSLKWGSWLVAATRNAPSRIDNVMVHRQLRWLFSNRNLHSAVFINRWPECWSNVFHLIGRLGWRYFPGRAESNDPKSNRQASITTGQVLELRVRHRNRLGMQLKPK